MLSLSTQHTLTRWHGSNLLKHLGNSGLNSGNSFTHVVSPETSTAPKPTR